MVRGSEDCTHMRSGVPAPAEYAGSRGRLGTVDKMIIDFSNCKEWVHNLWNLIFRLDSRTWLTMGFTREIVNHGKGDQIPKEGDEITVHYFGCLYNELADLPGEW